jgi:hypothetical protein
VTHCRVIMGFGICGAGNLISRMDELGVESFFVVGRGIRHLLCLAEWRHCRLVYVVERSSMVVA